MGKGIWFSMGKGIGIGIMVLYCFDALLLWCCSACTCANAGAGASDNLGSCAYLSVHKFSGADAGIGTNIYVFQYVYVRPQ